MKQPAPDPSASTYVGTVLDRTQVLEELALNYAESEYVSVQTREFVLAFAMLAQELRNEVVLQWNRYRTTRCQKHFELIQGLDHAIRDFASELRVPIRATVDRVPGVLSRLVSEKAAGVEAGASVVLRPVWNYSFKIQPKKVRERFRDKIKPVLSSKDAIDRVVAAIPDPLFVISFPAIERPSLHLHTVLGHELGHLMAARFSEPPGAFGTFLAEARERRTQQMTPRQKKEKKQKPVEVRLTDEAIDKATKARSRAIRELAADAANVFLFGMSAILGAAQFAFASDLGAPRGKYPLWGARLVMMIKLAKETGWLDFGWAEKISGEARKATDAVQRTLSDISALVGESLDAWTHPDDWVNFGHQSAVSLLPAIHQYLSESYSDLFPKPAAVCSQLLKLYERLKLGIPPDSTSSDETKPDSATLEQIFTAAWFYRIDVLADKLLRTEPDDDYWDKVSMLQRLTLKAVENVDFLNKFGQSIAEVHRK